MKRKYIFSLPLFFLSPLFSEELGTSTPSLSTKNQKLFVQKKQAELDYQEKSLSDQEEFHRIKEQQLAKQKQSLLDEIEKIASQEKELTTKEQLLLDRELKNAEKQKRVADREQEWTEAQQPYLDQEGDLSSFQELLGQDDSEASLHEKLSTADCYTFHTMHAGLRHTEARGVGYKDGYTTLEAFGIYDRHRSFMPFLDVRGHVFDSGRLAGNVGIGGRSYLSSINHLLGYYCYYDVRQDHHHLTAQQIGPGVELLSNRMEYRINGYFPVGEDESHKYRSKFHAFHNHRILIRSKQRQVMTGGDAEIGAHLMQSLKYDAYLGAGPYYFSSSHASSWGGKVRLLGRYKEYISLEASYSYDRLFRNVVQGTIAFNLPFGCKLGKKEKDCRAQTNLTLSRAAFSPYRFEIPVIKKVSIKEKAINPATNDPWTVWFVNNTSSSDGSFEHPFPTLVQAQNASSPNDMIYVFPGDGTTKGMDMGIALQDGQKFFGSAVAHQIHTTRGKITLPAFSQTYPTITNLNLALFSGTIVVPANYNEISGFNMLVNNLGTPGISNPANIQGIIIDHNQISGNVSYDAVDINGSGKMVITHNQFLGVPGGASISIVTAEGGKITGKFSHNVVSQYDLGFLMSLTDAVTVDFEISNNIILNSTGFAGIAWQILSGNPTSSNLLISSNFVSGFSNQGIVVQGVAPYATTKIIDNVVNNTMGAPASNAIAFSVSPGPNAGHVIVSDNQVTTSTTNTNTSGILVEVPMASPGNTFSSTIANNQVFIEAGVGSPSFGINVEVNSPNSTICSSITDNQVTTQATGATGINIMTIAPPTAIINIDDLSGNTVSILDIMGNVNFIAPDTCSP